MAHADTLRRLFPAVQDQVYLNTGSYGALPTTTASVMTSTLEALLTNGRLHHSYLDSIREVQESIRELLGSLLHVPPDSIALTESTGHGLNIVLWGIPFQPGDEVIVTDVEHEAALLPVFVQRERRSVSVRLARGGRTSEEWLASVERVMSARTRLLVVSHVAHGTGQRLPIEALTKLAHDRGVLVMVDGAQGAGVDLVDLEAVDCDFYAFPGYKWLCGPDGTGALYIRPELHSLLLQTFISGASLVSHDPAYTLSGTYLTAPGAARHEHARTDLVKWRGLLESLKLLHVQAGFDFMSARIRGLTAEVYDGLLEYSGVEVTTPREARAGLIHFRVRGQRDVTALKKLFTRRNIDVKACVDTATLRVSPSFYNNSEDIRRFLNVLEEDLQLANPPKLEGASP